MPLVVTGPSSLPLRVSLLSDCPGRVDASAVCALDEDLRKGASTLGMEWDAPACILGEPSPVTHPNARDASAAIARHGPRAIAISDCSGFSIAFSV